MANEKEILFINLRIVNQDYTKVCNNKYDKNE